MKSLEELKALRDKMKSQTDNRAVAGSDETVVKVGMATCGIAAGARPALTARRGGKEAVAQREHFADGLHRALPSGADRGSIQERAEVYIRSHDARQGEKGGRRAHRERQPRKRIPDRRELRAEEN